MTNNNILYRGGNLTNSEIDKIKNYLKNKKEDLPGSIVFSKSFLSFSKIEKEAKKYIRNTDKNDKNFSKVLFILEKKDNEGYIIFYFIWSIFNKNFFL